MTTRGWFITGTDTGVGKTLVSSALLMALVNAGQRAMGMKPVASGCDITPQGLRSEDAEALRVASNVMADYADINPYAFAAPTAPHLAAAAAGTEIEIDVIFNAYARLAARADAVVVEGIGGWMVPINRRQTMADVVRALDLPVILVVDLRLGGLNHALLSRAAIEACGCRLAAWVANATQAAPPDGYLTALVERLGAPLLGAIAHASPPQEAAHCLDLNRLGV